MGVSGFLLLSGLGRELSNYRTVYLTPSSSGAQSRGEAERCRCRARRRWGPVSKGHGGWAPPRQNFRDLGSRKGGRRLLEEPWPSSLAPSGGPRGSEPTLNKVLSACFPFLTDMD